MAGKPGKSGGARQGAGRKPKAAVEHGLEPQAHGGALKRSKEVPVEIPECDMLTLLKDIALGRVDASAGQIRAAIAAVQYTHTKRADGGKKDEAAEKAKAAAGGKFGAPPAPPRLVSGGK